MEKRVINFSIFTVMPPLSRSVQKLGIPQWTSILVAFSIAVCAIVYSLTNRTNVSVLEVELQQIQANVTELQLQPHELSILANTALSRPASVAAPYVDLGRIGFVNTTGEFTSGIYSFVDGFNSSLSGVALMQKLLSSRNATAAIRAFSDKTIEMCWPTTFDQNITASDGLYIEAVYDNAYYLPGYIPHFDRASNPDQVNVTFPSVVFGGNALLTNGMNLITARGSDIFLTCNDSMTSGCRMYYKMEMLIAFVVNATGTDAFDDSYFQILLRKFDGITLVYELDGTITTGLLNVKTPQTPVNSTTTVAPFSSLLELSTEDNVNARFQSYLPCSSITTCLPLLSTAGFVLEASTTNPTRTLVGTPDSHTVVNANSNAYDMSTYDEYAATAALTVNVPPVKSNNILVPTAISAMNQAVQFAVSYASTDASALMWYINTLNVLGACVCATWPCTAPACSTYPVTAQAGSPLVADGDNAYVFTSSGGTCSVVRYGVVTGAATLFSYTGACSCMHLSAQNGLVAAYNPTANQIQFYNGSSVITINVTPGCLQSLTVGGTSGNAIIAWLYSTNSTLYYVLFNNGAVNLPVSYVGSGHTQFVMNFASTITATTQTPQFAGRVSMYEGEPFDTVIGCQSTACSASAPGNAMSDSANFTSAALTPGGMLSLMITTNTTVEVYRCADPACADPIVLKMPVTAIATPGTWHAFATAFAWNQSIGASDGAALWMINGVAYTAHIESYIDGINSQWATRSNGATYTPSAYVDQLVLMAPGTPSTPDTAVIGGIIDSTSQGGVRVSADQIEVNGATTFTGPVTVDGGLTFAEDIQVTASTIDTLFINGNLNVPRIRISNPPAARCRWKQDCVWVTSTCPTNFLVRSIQLAATGVVEVQCCMAALYNCNVTVPSLPPIPNCGPCREWSGYSEGCIAQTNCIGSQGACLNDVCVQCEYLSVDWNTACVCPGTDDMCTLLPNGQCTTCGLLQLCSSGTCTCPGTISACGITGNTCTTCGVNQLCTSGTCTCPGTPAACGVTGSTCTACGVNQICIAGVCTTCVTPGPYANHDTNSCYACNQQHPCVSIDQYCDSDTLQCVTCPTGTLQSLDNAFCYSSACAQNGQWFNGDSTYSGGCYCESSAPFTPSPTSCTDTNWGYQRVNCGQYPPNYTCNNIYTYTDVCNAFAHNTNIAVLKSSTVNGAGTTCNCGGCTLVCVPGVSMADGPGMQNVPQQCSFDESATTWQSAITYLFNGVVDPTFDCSAQWFVAQSLVNYDDYGTGTPPIPNQANPQQPIASSGISPQSQFFYEDRANCVYCNSGGQCYLCGQLTFSRLFLFSNPTSFEMGCFTDDVVEGYLGYYQCDASCIFTSSSANTATPDAVIITAPTTVLTNIHILDDGAPIYSWCQTINYNDSPGPYNPTLGAFSSFPNQPSVASQSDSIYQTGWCFFEWSILQPVCCGWTGSDGNFEPQRCWIPWSNSVPIPAAAQQSFLDVGMCCMTTENVQAIAHSSTTTGGGWLSGDPTSPTSSQLNVNQCVQGTTINTEYYNPDDMIPLV
eukprot:TRINITY_DN1503_c0_g2_i2.p1 TRINITY_DN1503_c0_g2~~TRINITY_DN1503_c0_g2_i2.p1  ORF type:complete len:1539 (-),score=240.51 TRINITY_DN1503_c0_g2_i2:2474-7090(-)